ncbi:MAG TPA: nuclear transport factor 2 family protein [Thermomicrobiales bacterium]|nr:nuclear transport factor 2 family protein [Thermomicrobiales bacterium]
MSDGVALVRSFLDAENRRDWSAWRAVLDPQVRYVVAGNPDRIEGADAYLAHMQAAYESIPDWRFEIITIHGDDAVVMVEFNGAGHFTGEVAGRWLEMVPLRLPAVCVFMLKDGMITDVREYLAAGSRDRQLGVTSGTDS